MPYLGKPLGKTNTGRSIRPVRACNRAADMGDYHVLGNIPVEMALPKLSKKSLEDLQKIQKPKPSFWKKLFA
jgi:hypothetical protein